MHELEVDDLLSLAGKVAIVTGASQGIGARIAGRMAEAGAAVVVHFRSNDDGAAEVVAEIQGRGGKALAVRAELAEPDAAASLVSRTVSQFGRLDVLVNNAGAFPTRPLLELTQDEWRGMFASVVETTMLCTKAAAEQMKTSGGAIVNVASIEATHPAVDHSHYDSAKAAVVMFSRCAAQELGPFGIRVNAVSPGLIMRPGLEEQWPDGVARWRRKVPLARLGEAADVADACLFLAAPAGRWISGHNLVVDGGMTSAPIY